MGCCRQDRLGVGIDDTVLGGDIGIILHIHPFCFS
jgi:hypothetical protein